MLVGVSGFVCQCCMDTGVARVFQTTRLGVRSLPMGALDTSIMIENGGIREGPLFSRREGENESHAEKSVAGEESPRSHCCVIKD